MRNLYRKNCIRNSGSASGASDTASHSQDSLKSNFRWRSSFGKMLSFGALSLVLFSTFAFLPTDNQNAYAAVPDESVSSFSALQTAITTHAPANGVPYNIQITATFALTAQYSIPAGKNIVLSSDDPANHVLNRTATSGFGFIIPVTSALTITDLTINGSSGGNTIINANGGTFTLGSGGILQGQTATGADGAAVRAEGSGSVVNILPGSIIQNNTSADGAGSGVAIGPHSTATIDFIKFNMSGGTISGNTEGALGKKGMHGGGIYIGYFVNAVISGGTISNNKAYGQGGGIYLGGTNSTLAMSNVTMEGNRSILDPNAGGSGHSGFGGAVAIGAVGSAISFTNSTFNNNAAIGGSSEQYSGGGAIGINDKQDVTFTDCVITGNNASGGSGGGITTIGTAAGDVYLRGNTIISNNTADDHGGGVAIDGQTALVAGDSVRITDNASATFGGGVSDNPTATGATQPVTLSGNAIVANNRAVSGGGLNLNGSTTTLTDNVQISGNTATANGGGINSNNSPMVVSGSAQIANNTASANGGGLHAQGNTVAFTQTSAVIGNTATLDGGGVWVDNLANLTADAAVKFGSNHAQALYNRNPADDARYAANIHATSWTVPFVQGYNNYDINYYYYTPTPLSINTVTVTNDGNGSATASKSPAISGDIITLSATPKTGYQFSYWEVVSANVTLSNAAATEPIFTMPAADVTVKAYFTPIAKPDDVYTIVVANDGHGTGAASVSTAKAGTSVTVSATAKAGYVFDRWVVTSGGVTLHSTTTAKTTFVMPAANVALKVYFKSKSTTPATPSSDPTLKPSSTPKTGDNSQLPTLYATVMLSGIGLLGCAAYAAVNRSRRSRRGKRYYE